MNSVNRVLMNPRILCVLLLWCTSSTICKAELAMESFVASSQVSSGLSRGWRFRPNVNLLATGLAIFDIDPAGLQGTGYDVHLWTDAGIELAATRIPAGATAPLVNGFRTADLDSPVLLNAGEIYRVSADYGDSFVPNVVEYFRDPTAVTMNSQVTLIANTGTGAAGLNDFGLLANNDEFPTTADVQEPLGPNVVFTAVPEPSSFACLVFGFGFVGFNWFRKRR